MKYNIFALSVSVLALTISVANAASPTFVSYTPNDLMKINLGNRIPVLNAMGVNTIDLERVLVSSGQWDAYKMGTLSGDALEKALVSAGQWDAYKKAISPRTAAPSSSVATVPKTSPAVLYDGASTDASEQALRNIAVPKDSFKVNKDGDVILTSAGQKAYNDFVSRNGGAVSSDEFASQLYYNDSVNKGRAVAPIYTSDSDEIQAVVAGSKPRIGPDVLYGGPTKTSANPTFSTVADAIMKSTGDNRNVALKGLGIDTNALERTLVSSGQWDAFNNGTLSSGALEKALGASGQMDNVRTALADPTGRTESILNSALGGKLTSATGSVNPFAAYGSSISVSDISKLTGASGSSYLTNLSGLAGSGLFGGTKIDTPRISTSFGGSDNPNILAGLTGGAKGDDAIKGIAASFADYDSFLDFKKQQARPSTSGSGGAGGLFSGLSGSVKIGGVTLTGGIGAGGLTGSASAGGMRLADGSYGSGGLSGGFSGGSSMCAYGASCAGDVVSDRSFGTSSDGLSTTRGATSADAAIARERALAAAGEISRY